MKPRKTQPTNILQNRYHILYTVLYPALLMFNKWYFTSSKYFKKIQWLFTYAIWYEQWHNDYNDRGTGFLMWTLSFVPPSEGCKVTSTFLLLRNEIGLEILESVFLFISKDWFLNELRRITQLLLCIVQCFHGASINVPWQSCMMHFSICNVCLNSSALYPYRMCWSC